MNKRLVLIIFLVLFSSQAFAFNYGWNNDNIFVTNNNVISSGLDNVCNQDNSFLYRFGGLWGCGQLNASQMNITITYNVTNITIYQLNESDPVAIPLINELNNSLLWTNSTNAIYPKDLTKNVGIGTSSPTQKLDVNGSVRIGNSTGYITFGNDGSMHMFGTARKSDQKVIEAKTASKGASAPIDSLRAIGASGGVLKPMIQFSKTTQQDIYFEFHAPYSIDTSYPTTFHLVWAPGTGWTSGNYVWSLEYLIKNETEALNTGTPIIISTNITPTNANNLIETQFSGNITFTGDDQIIVCHLYRDVSADNADDVGEVNMIEMNFVRNSQGENIS